MFASAGFFMAEKDHSSVFAWAIKKPIRLPGSAFGKDQSLLLAASFFQHAQGALIGFVSGLLSFLSGGQSFISLAVGFVGTGLSASSCVFGSSQTSFGFFGDAAATGSQNSGQGQSREFQNVVHRVPLEVEFSIKAIPQLREISRRTYYLLLLVSKRSERKSCSFFSLEEARRQGVLVVLYKKQTKSTGSLCKRCSRVLAGSADQLPAIQLKTIRDVKNAG